MSYRQKCLAVDPGLRCERLAYWDSGRMIITSYVVMSGFNLISKGRSASSAWKNAWERLTQEGPG